MKGKECLIELRDQLPKIKGEITFLLSDFVKTKKQFHAGLLGPWVTWDEPPTLVVTAREMGDGYLFGVFMVFPKTSKFYSEPKFPVVIEMVHVKTAKDGSCYYKIGRSRKKIKSTKKLLDELGLTLAEWLVRGIR